MEEKDSKKETLKILYENAVAASASQDKRKENIDQKVSYLLTVAIALLAIIVEFFDITKIFNQTNINIIIICSAIFILYIANLIINLIVIINYIFIMYGKDYRIISPKMFISDKIRNEKYEIVIQELTEEYEKNADYNSITNTKQLKKFNINNFLLFINIIISTILYIALKVL